MYVEPRMKRDENLENAKKAKSLAPAELIETVLAALANETERRRHFQSRQVRDALHMVIV